MKELLYWVFQACVVKLCEYRFRADVFLIIACSHRDFYKLASIFYERAFKRLRELHGLFVKYYARTGDEEFGSCVSELMDIMVDW